MAIRPIIATGALVLAAVCVACASATEQTTTTPPTTATTTTTTAPTTTTTEARLTPQEVFAATSPGLAFIDTPLATGSAVVFSEGLLVTNAHVVWPETEVRVVFPDGSEFLEAPVLAIDQLTDLAIIDLRDEEGVPEPLPLGNAEGFPVGAELYLVGYPGEVDEFPDATLTRGVLSRFREAAAFDLTYIQTDAVIAGGQSGGALVSDSGEVVGISGFGTGGFALATSVPDALELLGRMMQGEDTDGLNDRRPVVSDVAPTEFTVDLPHFMHDEAWVFEVAARTDIELTVESDADANIALIASDGVVEEIADENLSGTETLSFTTSFETPYFVVLNAITYEPATAEVTSSVPLTPWADPDNGAVLVLGEPRPGHVDYPGDNDYFTLSVEEGQTVTIRVESLLIVPGLVVDLPENEDEPIAFAEEGSGGGLFGTDAEVTFTAEETRDYIVGVIDAVFFGPGGYIVTAELE